MLDSSGRWLLRWIDRSPLRPAATSLLIAVVACILFSTLLWLTSAWSERGRNAVLLVSFLLGVGVYLFHRLVTASTQNLQRVVELDPEIPAELTDQTASRRALALEVAAGLLFAAAVHIYFVRNVGAVPIAFSITSVTVTTGFFGVLLFLNDFAYRYLRFLVRSARRVRIDLFRMDRYHCYATPLVQITGTLAVFLSIILLMPSFLGSAYGSLVPPLLLLFLVTGALTLSVWIWPVITLRNRVNAEKVRELERVDQALRGYTENGVEAPGIDISTLKPFELIQYQSHVRNLPTWPLHAHAQRLAIFGVLPPLSWVMAALIENALDAYL